MVREGSYHVLAEIPAWTQLHQLLSGAAGTRRLEESAHLRQPMGSSKALLVLLSSLLQGGFFDWQTMKLHFLRSTLSMCLAFAGP